MRRSFSQGFSLTTEYTPAACYPAAIGSLEAGSMGSVGLQHFSNLHNNTNNNNNRGPNNNNNNNNNNNGRDDNEHSLLSVEHTTEAGSDALHSNGTNTTTTGHTNNNNNNNNNHHQQQQQGTELRGYGSSGDNDSRHSPYHVDNDNNTDDHSHPAVDAMVDQEARARAEAIAADPIFHTGPMQAQQSNFLSCNRRWYPRYHLCSPGGWLSVPGGVVQHRGVYHVFSQHHPFTPNWGLMHWAHFTSTDLVHWQSQPIALEPSAEYDRDGCFSGSAISHQGTLYVFYTGHTWRVVGGGGGGKSSANGNGNGGGGGGGGGESMAAMGGKGNRHHRGNGAGGVGGAGGASANHGRGDDGRGGNNNNNNSGGGGNGGDGDDMWGGAPRAEMHQQQCLAVSTDGIHFEKRGVLIRPPKGFVHFRDPKVWRDGDKWHMVCGARSPDTDSGILLVYTSDSLDSWDETQFNIVAQTDDHNVFMWECPDLFPLTTHNTTAAAALRDRAAAAAAARGNYPNNNNNHNNNNSNNGGGVPAAALQTPAAPLGIYALVHCPQGMNAVGYRYRNRFQCGYTLGALVEQITLDPVSGTPVMVPARPQISDNNNNNNNNNVNNNNNNNNNNSKQQQPAMVPLTSLRYVRQRPFFELDDGFDYYAAQTFLADDGRRIVVAWLDMWESPMPSKADGWSGVLTLPRELVYCEHRGRLLVRPVRELLSLRQASAAIPPQTLQANAEILVVDDCGAFELEVVFNVQRATAERYGVWLGHGCEIVIDAQSQRVVLQRHFPDYFLSGYRSVDLPREAATVALRIFVDASSVEVFVDDGYACLSARVYPADGDRCLKLFAINGEATLVSGTVYELEHSVSRADGLV